MEPNPICSFAERSGRLVRVAAKVQMGRRARLCRAQSTTNTEPIPTVFEMSCPLPQAVHELRRPLRRSTSDNDACPPPPCLLLLRPAPLPRDRSGRWGRCCGPWPMGIMSWLIFKSLVLLVSLSEFPVFTQDVSKTGTEERISQGETMLKEPIWVVSRIFLNDNGLRRSRS